MSKQKLVALYLRYRTPAGKQSPCLPWLGTPRNEFAPAGASSLAWLSSTANAPTICAISRTESGCGNPWAMIPAPP